MKLVIDIDDNIYTRLFDNGIDDPDDPIDDPIDIATVIHDTIDIATAIRNGTPLPEHHGRLIDYENVVNAIDDWINTYGSINATYYLRNRVKNVPTILEGSDSE